LKEKDVVWADEEAGHAAILESVDDLDSLPPGLYEMKILNPTGDPDCRKPQYSVKFEERGVEDLRASYPRKAFERVRRLSEVDAAFYELVVGPWIRAVSTPWSATLVKWLHPMRTSRYLSSDVFDPRMAGVAILAGIVRQYRAPADSDNRFLALEHEASEAVARALEAWTSLRDRLAETMFNSLYE